MRGDHPPTHGEETQTNACPAPGDIERNLADDPLTAVHTMLIDLIVDILNGPDTRETVNTVPAANEVRLQKSIWTS
ncbi:MAG: hypothetical protein M1832_005174 [Thelocarpon impressellum]|nr:MAG: hypothetical protein M1832_005174 [Thelocarpon impressellum]